ncbi:DUF4269 domain-containing protein [Flavobacterium sp. NST-5]|uniref:DUF4269 domain-containing protein n=1 Tax=Flavobacterium ichthyis TaxID=2698827 RepID=A0ABW9Z6R6_9FLAO|nr:DUF4269 domain-containing protein [Flavobacterium ichthyis]NBL64349.1 DUF4269 domain-containing protein [Flavobacterium ichthyis]
MIDFLSIAYLKNGTTLQQEAFFVLEKYEVMQKLSRFTPVLAGTIPLNIATATSDLDILCCCDDAEIFMNHIRVHFAKAEKFSLEKRIVNGISTVIANFFLDGFEIEIFGQNVPVQQQNGYRHMIAEAKILAEKGENFRQEILRLKKSGLKTEPAFAKLLNLKGDPYQALLDFFP